MSAFINKSRIRPRLINVNRAHEKKESEVVSKRVEGLSKPRSLSNIKIKDRLKKRLDATACSKFRRMISNCEPDSSLSSSALPTSKEIAGILTKRLEKEMKYEESSSKKLEIHKAVFEEILKTDKIFGSLLNKVKRSYERKLKSLSAGSMFEVNERVKKEIERISEKLEESAQGQDEYDKKIEKLCRENAELNRMLQNREDQLQEIKTQLATIEKIDISRITKNESYWNFLVEENKTHQEHCKSIKKNSKSLRTQNKTLVRKLKSLRKQGVPIDQIYQKLRKEQKKPKFQNTDEIPEDNSENEALIEGPPKPVAKPEIVPLLFFENLHAYSESSTE